ncbi:hypothetical protein [Rhizomicrobium electricum]|uniref:Uncharacterized protein n=1 Tax=Rhizomicrobium electricum TaxID=480070 RepID=A0ABP3PLT7_9PROT|nr:hypothetical protein [Rhizomicrobium electricum]NIJ48528.1 hypothetical protein [Rhizomicrobium electricum]
MPEADDITITETVSDLALVALEQGLAARQGAADFAPFVLIESGGHCYIRAFAAKDDVVEQAAAFLARESDTTSTYALTYDGTVTVEGTPFDAILVIAGEPGADAFVFTQRYDAAASPIALIGDPALIGQHDSLLQKVP